MPADDPRWILGGLRTLRHPIQLACLPHAGGSASAYRTWLAGLSAAVDVLPVQLPGRESRIHTPFAVDLAQLVDELAEVLANARRGELALFGHSMGALLAAMVCQTLERGGTAVRHLFVSGHPGRSGPPADPRLAVGAEDSDEVLLRSLAVLDPAAATPRHDDMLRDVLLPVLRADLRLVGGAAPDGIRVTVPVTALAGVADPIAGPDLRGWAAITTRDFAAVRLDGGHFYLASEGAALSAVILDRLAPSNDRRVER